MDHNKAELSSENVTLLDESGDYYKREQIVIENWSQTGRGSHVDFGDDEIVPLQPGRFLGRGAVGDVHEITLQGWRLAHKKIFFRKKIGEEEKKEIEILKRLSHIHVIQLIGTYTHQRFLGILLYPVAVCDMHTFFEDVEAWTSTNGEASRVERQSTLEPVRRDRLEALEYDFPTERRGFFAWPVYSKIGCLVSAIEYLHQQKIRHKDLKPSNILLSPDRLWLTDFGSATDFTLLSQSATDNERGTPRYFAPEMAQWKLSGRAADIFSLGCILLEIIVLQKYGTFSHIRKNRSSDPSFHANLDRVDEWLDLSNNFTYQRTWMLRLEIRDMLAKDPGERPPVLDVYAGIIACDLKGTLSERSIFCDDCRIGLIPKRRILEFIDGNRVWKREYRKLHEKASSREDQLEYDLEAVVQDLDIARARKHYYQKEAEDMRSTSEKLSAKNKEQEGVIADLRERLDSLTAPPKSEDWGYAHPRRSLSEDESQMKIQGRRALEHGSTSRASSGLDLSLDTSQTYKGERRSGILAPTNMPGVGNTNMISVSEFQRNFGNKDSERSSSTISNPYDPSTRGTQRRASVRAPQSQMGFFEALVHNRKKPREKSVMER